MRVLLIDTCGATGSVAIADTSCEPAKVVSATLPGRSSSERLVATVRELGEQSGAGLRGIGAIAVVHGPGSFTGVRVGLSAAKGLCEALCVPLLAISRLAVLASMGDAAPATTDAAPGTADATRGPSAAADTAPGTRVLPVLDAGRGEFYCAEYLDGARVREGLVTRDELMVRTGGSVIEQADPARRSLGAIVVCEAGVAEALRELRPRIVAEPGAETALAIALRRIERGEFDDVATVDANYLRRTDLEIFAKIHAQSAKTADAKIQSERR